MAYTTMTPLHGQQHDNYMWQKQNSEIPTMIMIWHNPGQTDQGRMTLSLWGKNIASSESKEERGKV